MANKIKFTKSDFYRNSMSMQGALDSAIARIVESQINKYFHECARNIKTMFDGESKKPGAFVVLFGLNHEFEKTITIQEMVSLQIQPDNLADHISDDNGAQLCDLAAEFERQAALIRRAVKKRQK